MRSITVVLMTALLGSGAVAADRVKTANGVVEGAGRQSSGVRIFRGIPFAQPPVGDLRWQPPQPPKDWTGVRPAKAFSASCMQRPIFGDMNFRSNGKSEDCLYLNVWTPAKSAEEKLPVMVYFYGGGFVAGDGSEPRYDGESMAARGIVAVTLNYRLGLFGFFAHPELTRESPHHASGNYGLLDQNAALLWVHRNIAAFGGDPGRVTIAGESAGSISVSAQMASPLSKDLIHGAIGESGSMMMGTPTMSLAEGERSGVKLADSLGASSLAALRAISTARLYEAMNTPLGRLPLLVDGYFLPEPPAAIFAAGKQAHVPLLVGWNSEEMSGRTLFGKDEQTPENYEKKVRQLYGEHAGEVLRLYPAAGQEQMVESSTALASDRFLGYSTWKWFDLHRKTSGQPVYRYFYARARPPMNASMGDAVPGLAGGVIKGPQAKASAVPPARGAVHSAEIEYALGNLATNKVYAWTPDDYKISKLMQAYFANFIKTGDPNGSGLPPWPAVHASGPVQVMRLDVASQAEAEQHTERYSFLDGQAVTAIQK